MSYFRGMGPVDTPNMTMGENLPPVSSVDMTSGPFDRYAPPMSYQVLNPYARTPSTHYNAPQAYGLNSTQLRTVITGQIRESQNQTWYTTDALPRVEIRGQRYGWSVLRFEEGLAEIVPYEGVPRILETTMDQQTRSVVRRAIAVFSEESYRSTQEGQSMYALAMRHIATVVADTQAYEVILAYFNCKNYNVEWELAHGYFNNKTIADILSREVNFFAAVQKVGFAKLDAMVTGYHSKYGVEDLDMWILPREVRVFLGTVTEENTTYHKGGEQAVNQLKEGIGRLYDDAGPALIFGNVYKVYFTRTYIVNKDSQSINPMVRDKMIGEFFPAVSSQMENGHGYKSSNRIIEIYDEDLDDMVIITLEKLIDGISYMFNSDTGKVESIDNLVANKRQHVLNFDEDIKQHFLYRSYAPAGYDIPEPIDLIGEMRQEHFSTNSQLETAKSIVRQLSQNMGCGGQCDPIYKAFSAGVDLVRKFSKSSIGSWLLTVPTQIDDEYSPTEQHSDDRAFPTETVPVLPYDTSTGATVTRKISELSFNQSIDFDKIKKGDIEFLTNEDLIPYMTNWPGLVYLSERKFTNSAPLLESTQKTIVEFVDAVRKIVHYSKNLLFGNPIFDKKYTLPYFPVQSEENVFLNNLNVFQDVVPVWIMTRPGRGKDQNGDDGEYPSDIDGTGDSGKTNDKGETLNFEDLSYLDKFRNTIQRVMELGSPELPYQENVGKLVELFYQYAGVENLVSEESLDELIKALSSNEKSSYDNSSATVIDAAVTMLCTIAATLIFRIKMVSNTTFDSILNGTKDKYEKELEDYEYGIVGTRSETKNQTYLAGKKSTFFKQELLIDILTKNLSKLKEDNFLKLEISKGVKDLFENIIDSLFKKKNNTTEGYNSLDAIYQIGGYDKNKFWEINKLLESAKSDDILNGEDAQEFESFVDNIGKSDELLSTTEIQVARKMAKPKLETGSTTGQYVRTSFTISYDQLFQYRHILDNEKSLIIPGHKGNNNGDGQLYLTVSLPSSGYNRPASLKEIKDFVSQQPQRNTSKITIPRKIISDIENKFDNIQKRKTPAQSKGENTLITKPDSALFALLNPDSDILQKEVKGKNSITTGLNSILEKISYFLRAIIISLYGSYGGNGDVNGAWPDGEIHKNAKTIVSYIENSKIKIPKGSKLYNVSAKIKSKPIEAKTPTSKKRSRSNYSNDNYSSSSKSQYINTMGVGGRDNEGYNNDNNDDDYNDDDDDNNDDDGYFGSKLKIGAKAARIVKKEELTIYQNKRKDQDSKIKKAKKMAVLFGKTQPASSNFASDLLVVRTMDLIFMDNSDSYGGNPVISDNWNAVEKLSVYELDKLMTFAVLLTPLNKQNLLNFIWHDIILPVNFLLLRPHMRYKMAAGIKTRGGLDTGGTFVNVEQNNMMEGDAVETKTRLTHYSYESKADVTNPARVFIAFDIFCFNTGGGAGTEFYTNEDYSNYSNDEHLYPRNKSIFVAAIPYEERDFQNPMDASGRFSHYTIQGYSDTKKSRELHYSTASLLNAMWGFRHITDRGSQEVESWYHPGSDGQYTPNYQPKNTAMFRGPYTYYDSRVKKMVAKPGTGHFKSYAYPGCLECRNGGLKQWVSPIYSGIASN